MPSSRPISGRPNAGWVLVHVSRGQGATWGRMVRIVVDAELMARVSSKPKWHPSSSLVALLPPQSTLQGSPTLIGVPEARALARTLYHQTDVLHIGTVLLRPPPREQHLGFQPSGKLE